jgi:hypothetical protein
VKIRRPVGGGSLAHLPAQLDTAADLNVVPWNVVNDLKLAQLDLIPTAGFGGHVTLVPTFLVELAIRQLEPVVVKVAASRDEPYVLLGRDVLNRYRIVLNGPELFVEIT